MSAKNFSPMPALFFKILMRLLWRVILTIIGLMKFRKVLMPSEYALSILRNSSVLSNFNEINVRYLNRWHEANVQYEIGNFHQSVVMHTDALMEVRDIMKSRLLPITYSYQFGSNIGHIALLYIHQSAQNLDLLPKRSMHLYRTESNLSTAWLESLKGNVELLLSFNQTSFTELPTSWPFVENLRLLSTGNGFIDQYSFLEKYFKGTEFYTSLDTLEFSNGYMEKAQKRFEELGIRPGNRFVSLHIRNGKNVGIRRSQNPLNYVKSIRELISRGYQVLRIGDTNMDPLPDMRGLIDLREVEHHWLHPFVLSQAKLHIGTMSGPSIMSMALRTPTLITNATSLARNTLTGNFYTFFIPKHLYIKGKKMSLRDSLNHAEGYSEIDGNELQRRSISYVENSEEEIFAATCEVLSYVESNSLNSDLISINERINCIRNDAQSISYGKFTMSSCILNPQFLD